MHFIRGRMENRENSIKSVFVRPNTSEAWREINLFYSFIRLFLFFLFPKTDRHNNWYDGRRDLFPKHHVHPALNPVSWSKLLFRLAMIPIVYIIYRVSDFN